MRLEAIRAHYERYQEARRILASNFTSIAERKAAIHVRDEFMEMAAHYVSELLCGAEMIEAALENYFSYSPSRRDEKALGPVQTARNAIAGAVPKICQDNHLLVHPRRTLSEQWAAEDEERQGEP